MSEVKQTGNRAIANLHRPAYCIRHAAHPQEVRQGRRLVDAACAKQPTSPFSSAVIFRLCKPCPANFRARRADATQRCPRRHIAPGILNQRLNRQRKKKDPCRSTDATHTQKPVFRPRNQQAPILCHHNSLPASHPPSSPLNRSGPF